MRSMKTTFLSILTLVTSSATILWAAPEMVVTPQIESVGLFKNGIAIVTAFFPGKEPGTYIWEDVPKVVHGTFWIESNAEISTQTTTRIMERTANTESSVGSLQQDLAGKEVSIRLKAATNAPAASIAGRVWALPDTESSNKSWDRMQQTQPKTTPVNTTGYFLVLDRGEKREYIDVSTIASVEVTGPFQPAKRKVEKPVLLFRIAKPDAATGLVRISYLSKGMAWAPSYQIDLTDKHKLNIRQNALVRNELVDIKDTEVSLISGFPNIRFSHVDSPMWPGGSLAAFVQQVNLSDSRRSGAFDNGGVIHSQAILSNYSSSVGPGSIVPEMPEAGNASGDIHYESIGKQTLATGDSLARDVASVTAAYQRAVEWKMADRRDAWDGVQFNNPFTFPMTIGSASIVEGGKFRGQSPSTWANPGQQLCLQVTKALSVYTKHSEYEV